jgi:ABC-2 type transport system permease protein
MGLFLVISGYFFTGGNLISGRSEFNWFLDSVLFIYVLAVPLLTMRLLSEEKKQKTDQLLLTSPISVTDIVVGKFLAAFVVFLITVFVTALYAVVIGIFGDLAFWETVGGYIGFILVGASFISVGVLISALSENQASAAFFSFFALLFIYLLSSVRAIAPQDAVFNTIFAAALVAAVAAFFFFNTRSWIATGIVAVLGAIVIVVLHLVRPQIYTGLISDFLSWFSLTERFEAFSLGLVQLDEVVFYLSFITIFLFLSARLIEKRRWA